MDDAAIRRALVRQFEDGRNLDETHEIYHDDAVLEFPQSGERFVGKDNFLTWRKQYPSNVTYRIRRITAHGELWFVELLVSYNGGPPVLGVGLMQFRGEKVATETVYARDGFDAAPWRAAWATRFDPLASVSPADWEDGAEFGIGAPAALTR
jgi:hypothetical protein